MLQIVVTRERCWIMRKLSYLDRRKEGHHLQTSRVFKLRKACWLALELEWVRLFLAPQSQYQV